MPTTPIHSYINSNIFNDETIKDIQELEDKKLLEQFEIISSTTTFPNNISYWFSDSTIGVNSAGYLNTNVATVISTPITTDTIGSTFVTVPPTFYHTIPIDNFVGYNQGMSALPDLGLEPGEDMEEVLAEFREWRRAKKERIINPLQHEFSRYVEA